MTDMWRAVVVMDDVGIRPVDPVRHDAVFGRAA